MKRHDTYIAGTDHYGNIDLIRSLTAGTALDLEPEPTNQYDPNAVKVIYDNKHLGYIPRDLAGEVARLIAGGHCRGCETRKDASRTITVFYDDE